MEKRVIPGRQILFTLLLAMLACTRASAANFADTSRKQISLFDKTTGHTIIASKEQRLCRGVT